MSIWVFNCFDSASCYRSLVSGVKLDGNISTFKKLVTEELKLKENEIELIYGGVKLKDESLLAAYNIEQGATVHLMKKVSLLTKEDKPLSKSEIQSVVKSIKEIVLNPAYRNTIQRLQADHTTMNELISSSLYNSSPDPIALALAQDAELLTMLADPASTSTVESVLAKHPSLAKAAESLIARLRQEFSQGQSQSQSGATAARAGLYSLDRMSDDEDDMDTNQGPLAGAPRAITTNLLASALAAVSQGAGVQRPSGPSTSSPGRPGGSSSGGASAGMAGGSSGISSDFLRTALQQALGASPAFSAPASAGQTGSAPAALPAQGPPQLTEAQLESQLQQLREMGITQENVARQALIAAGGDIQGALEIIYGEDL